MSAGPDDAHLRTAAPRRPARRIPRLVRRGLLAAVAFTALLAMTAAGVAALAYRHYDSQIRRVAALQPQDRNIRQPVKQQNAQNYLIIGSDSREGLASSYGLGVDGARSDTTILVHLSADRSRVTIVSFPRDAWVRVPRCTDSSGTVAPAHDGMFNSAFSAGGPTCTIALVQQLTGIAVKHYIEINFAGFLSMVKALGSVSVCSKSAVFDSDSGLRLSAGVNKLNPTQALAYVRARHSLGDGSDLGRIARQQLFLGSVLRQALAGSMLSDPRRLAAFVDAATKSITVDNAGTSFSDLRVLATSMRGLDPKRVQLYTSPIANPNYSPPGTDQTGKVLLDDAAGRVLYDTIIDDYKTPAGPPSTKPPVKTGSTAAGAKPTATKASVPITAADSSCGS